METLLTKLTSLFSQACEANNLEARFGEVVLSNRPDLGQFQCNGALPAAKQAGTNPRELAQAILDALPENELIESVELAGPGFININITDSALAAHIAELTNDELLGTQALSTGRKTTVDYGGYNVAKSLHVGHLRSTVIGESLKRILAFAGDEVTGDVHLGDWGTQMGMVIIGIQDEQPDLPYFDESFSGDYPTESPVTMKDLERIYPMVSGACKEDEAMRARALEATALLQGGHKGYRALWQHFVNITIEATKKTTDLLGAHFELWNGEAHYHDRIGTMVERLTTEGHAVESDGALVIHLEGEEELPPLMLTKSDGAYLYGTSDLATIEERVTDLAQDFILYVVDDRQSLHFRQVFQAATQVGLLDSTDVHHAAFGTITGKDRKPYKSRSGAAAKLGDLIEEAIDAAEKRMAEVNIGREYTPEEQKRIATLVGVAAVKFADLINDKKSNYIFDSEQFTTFEGKTGPYLLYSAVRMKSILRKVEDAGYASGTITVTGDADRTLQLKLTEFPYVLESAYTEYAPHLLAAYTFELAQSFNNFYQHCNIMNEEDEAVRASWISLTQLSLRMLEQCLNLLTIEVPERM